ncbi:Pkinase-domain-containing protein [Dacryopinax primogenitus]|uniref:Pkinase-domain-containing protein n=1 Tax=Dacryopinax primogenitus (strain DJM 731) TaxID=1858805 RepID=M5GAU8_DACPD|nr:Pkinase-domain-containing protein [Dacryopinax primogenitus]EJU01053.1 Pkinase-domain-containing protein [Dacryopinax primogenitus]
MSGYGSAASTIKASSHLSSPAPSPTPNPHIQLQPATSWSTGPPVIDLPIIDDVDEGYDDGGTLWITPPQPLPPNAANRRPLVPPIQTEQINGQPNGRPSPSHGISPLGSAGQPSSDKGYGDWELRPQPEDVYDNLDQFFPGHDLDKPVLETASAGGKSPVDDVAPLGQTPAAGATPKSKHKKSIRYVANVARKQLHDAEAGDDQKTIMKRKRTTKLWNSKIEEVAPGQGLQTPSEPESPAVPGQRPTVRYTKGQLIGKGTYGRVYMGMNLATGEMLAIKQVELPKTASDRADNRQQLVVDAIKSESNTLKDLDHPNIVQYLGCEETEDFFNIFLEYVPGGSVGHTLRRYGRFREDVIKNITSQILEGLAYLHAMGITHRDLKADNILIDHEGNCKISDFGTSKRAQDAYANQAGATLMTGSIPWMAPEMFMSQGEGYGAKVDIWSIGCVFLEMWAGERPWSQDELYQVMYKVMTTKSAPPVPENTHLTPGAEEFRLKCCAINPEDRPTAAELRKEPYLILPKDWKFPTPFSTISAVD